jgi:hypothetical protein
VILWIAGVCIAFESLIAAGKMKLATRLNRSSFSDLNILFQARS